jgi:RecA/RadA recombinase
MMSAPDLLLQEVADQVARDTGSTEISSPEENERAIFGIPFPSLSLCWFYGINVWVLGRILELFGQEGCCKSSMLFEMSRWHAAYNGVSTILENENKDAAVLANSIYETHEIRQRVRMHPTDTLQDWMKGVNHWTNRFDEKCKDPAIGYTFPFLLGLDSLTATADEEQLAKVKASGTTDRSFPIEALKMSSFFKGFPSRMRSRPWTFAATNHLKPGTDSAGRPKDNVPGGKAMKFMASVRVKMSKIGDVKSNSKNGVKIQLQLVKNSLAPGGRKLQVDMLWRNVEGEDGMFHQETYWDWDAATIWMLLEIHKTDKSLWNRIKEVVDFGEATQKRVYSKVLGIPKDKPVSWSVAGNMLEHRPDLLEKLYPLLMISRGRPFVPGTDFKVEVKKIIRETKPTAPPMPDRILIGNAYTGAADEDTEVVGSVADISAEPDDYEDDL